MNIHLFPDLRTFWFSEKKWVLQNSHQLDQFSLKNFKLESKNESLNLSNGIHSKMFGNSSTQYVPALQTWNSYNSLDPCDSVNHPDGNCPHKRIIIKIMVPILVEYRSKVCVFFYQSYGRKIVAQGKSTENLTYRCSSHHFCNFTCFII